MELISSETPKARKEHRCMACDFLRDDLPNTVSYLNFSEKRDVVKARRNNWKIQKGEVYTKQFLKDGGDVYGFKAITAIHDICIDHDLYPES